MRRAPGAAQQPAWRIDRFVERLAECHVAREDGRLALRLTVAAHSAVGDDPTIFEDCKRRVERMEWSAARRERIERLRVKRKARAAVLHYEARRRQHASGTELPIERLDVGNNKPARV